MKKIFFLFALTFSCINLFAGRWSVVDCTYKQLTSGAPIDFYANRKCYKIRLDINVPNDESRFAFVNFLQDYDCYNIKPEKKDDGSWSVSYKYQGYIPFYLETMYVNEESGYAIYVSGGYKVYYIEPCE